MGVWACTQPLACANGVSFVQAVLLAERAEKCAIMSPPCGLPLLLADDAYKIRGTIMTPPIEPSAHALS